MAIISNILITKPLIKYALYKSFNEEEWGQLWGHKSKPELLFIDLSVP